jgi:hypothetical protein
VGKTALPAEAAPTKRGEIVALASRAQKGDRTALPALREVLKDPAAVDLLGGDLARQSQRTLIGMFSGQNLLLKESIIRKLDLLRSELAGPAPTPLERLLVERVVTCWLHLHHLEQIFAQKDSISLDLGTYYQRSITSAQKRYLAAIKTLAQVRKLALPVLRVNIGGGRMNGAAHAPASGRC